MAKLVPEGGVREGEDELKVRVAAEADKAGRKVDDYIRVELEALSGARERLKVLAREIVEHFDKRREVIEGKAMAVGRSRAICMDLYDEIVALQPDWHADEDEAGFVKVIMMGSAAEGGRVAARARNKPRREALARRFKDPEDDLRLVIVCDMWLLRRVARCLRTLYGCSLRRCRITAPANPTTSIDEVAASSS